MKNILLITFLVFSSVNFDTDWFHIFRADIYVSQFGNDANSGSWFFPVQTVVHAQEIANAGDRIALKSGDATWDETLTINKDSIIWKSYGGSSNPAISVVIWDSIAYPNVVFKNITISSTDNNYSEDYTGTIYYFASDGSDSNDGLTKAEPKQTLSAASALTLSAGDAVLFNSEDIFEGTITAQTGVTYGAYGLKSSKPVIYGSDEITDWTVHSGNIYKATYATTINQLFVDGERLLAAREPDTGFFTVDAAPTTSQITSDELNGALNYTGTQCIIHSSSYGLETKAVTGSSSTTITLASAPFGDVTANEKFILVGKLEFLDAAGEWYYDAAADLVYVWLPDNANPSTHTIRGSVTDYGLTASSKSGFTVKDIQFEQQKTAGVSISGSTDYLVDNITVFYPDQKGIKDNNCENGTYTNNTITGANHHGIESEVSDSMLIENNTVTNIALFEQLGLSGIGPWYNGSGIYSNGDGNEIYSNRCDEIGYNGIAFYGVNTVKYNYITNFCRTKNDGGGIYTSAPVNYGNENNKGSLVEYNTILYGWGVTTNATANSVGIYLDASSGSVTVRYNNVGYCSAWGIFFHKGNNHVATNNILFSNKTGFITAYNGDYSQFKHNYVYGLSGQLIGQRVNSDPVVTTTAVDSNYYVNHYATLNFNVDWTGSKNWSFWKTSTGFDAHTSYDTTALGSSIDEKFIVNATAAPVTWYKNNSEYLVDAFTGDSLDATFVLPAYSSKIVTGKNIGLFLPYVEDSVPPEPQLTDSLVAVYEFEDSGTTLVDSHTNGLNGTNKNASNVDYSATPVAGKPGNAYSYSGATFRYSIVNDDALLDFSGAFSIAVAVNPTTLSSARGVFSKRDGTYSEFELYINANGSVSFTLVENGNNINRITCTTATGVITAATDNLIVLRSDGTDRKAGFTLSVNGVVQSLTYTYSGTVSSDLSVGIANTTAPFSVGTALQYAANMTGKISQLAIWSYEIPDSMIEDLYDSGNFKSYLTW